MNTKMMIRTTVALAVAAVWALGAAPAGAAAPRLYWTLQVPAQDNVPQSQRLYASLPNTGTPNRNGDPVILHSGRNTISGRQDWWFAWPTYPDNTVTGGSGLGSSIGEFFEDCFHFELPPVGCDFQGATGLVKVRVKLVNRYSGKCLAVQGGGAVAHNHAIIQWTCERNARDQMWTYVLHYQERTPPHVEELQPFANSHTCLGRPQPTAGNQLRVFGGPGQCPHWVLFKGVRDHRRVPTFINPA